MTESKSLISLPTAQLLDQFGAGKPTPGSGCAAALMSLLSANMIGSIAKLTVTKGREQANRERAAEMVRILEDRIMLDLKRLFEKDAQLFDEVIRLRLARDAERNFAEKQRLRVAASEKLRDASELLFQVAELAFQLIENGAAIYKIGFQPAMGDAGAGISAAVASVTTCIFVLNLNVKASGATWRYDVKDRCDQLHDRLESVQEDVFALIAQSRLQAAEAIDLEPRLPFT